MSSTARAPSTMRTISLLVILVLTRMVNTQGNNEVSNNWQELYSDDGNLTQPWLEAVKFGELTQLTYDSFEGDTKSAWKKTYSWAVGHEKGNVPKSGREIFLRDPSKMFSELAPFSGSYNTRDTNGKRSEQSTFSGFDMRDVPDSGKFQSWERLYAKPGTEDKPFLYATSERYIKVGKWAMQNWMGYVTFNPETSELVVAIRGTILMREWLADLRGLIPFNYPQSKASKLKDQSPSDQIRIHRGFYQLYTNKVTWANTLAPIFRRKIQRSLSRSSSFFLASLKTDSIPVSEEELEEQASKRDSNKKSLKEQLDHIFDYVFQEGNSDIRPKRIVFCGHSLGSALATLAAFDLKARGKIPDSIPCEVFSYAGPAVGNKHFAEAFDQLPGLECHRFVNKLDWVPFLPLGAPHVGKLYEFDPRESKVKIRRTEPKKHNTVVQGVIDIAGQAGRVLWFFVTQDTERLQIQHNLEMYIYMIATDLGTFPSRRNPLMMNKDTHVIELQKEDQSDHNLRDEDFEQFPVKWYSKQKEQLFEKYLVEGDKPMMNEAPASKGWFGSWFGSNSEGEN